MLVSAPDFARRRLRSRLRRWRPFLVPALALAAAIATAWLLYFSSVLAVSAVEVSGNGEALSTARIEKIAAVPLGEQLVRVDLEAIRARVEGIDAVRSVEVSRAWPDGISIKVVERQPIAVVRRGEDARALDADGVLFARRAALLPPDLPVVETALNVNAATLGEAARVVLALRSDIAARVRIIQAESIDRIVLKLDGGVSVEWGSAEESENKAQVLAILLRDGVREIDVSVPGRPTTR